METLTCRLLPYAVADGPCNMAADEVLLESALEGTASLRFYGWSPPTLSLGYFQPASVRTADSCLAALPFVRRPSGGDTLVHDHELTYAMALPPGAPWQTRALSWLNRMHGILAAALDALAVPARLHEFREHQPFVGPLCFHHFTVGDLLLGDAKIVGSAQRKHRGALLQHGAILLARSTHAPTLPGIRELIGRDLPVEAIVEPVCQEFIRQTDWSLVPSTCTQRERLRIEELTARKYVPDAWNRKR